MTASQIVETHYASIQSMSARLCRDTATARDLAHDVCYKILTLEPDQLDKLKANPPAYIFTMLRNRFRNIIERQKFDARYKSELLYLCDKATTMDEFTALTRLNNVDHLVYAVCVHYPTAKEFAKKTGICRETSEKYIKDFKNKLLS